MQALGLAYMQPLQFSLTFYLHSPIIRRHLQLAVQLAWNIIGPCIGVRVCAVDYETIPGKQLLYALLIGLNYRSCLGCNNVREPADFATTYPPASRLAKCLHCLRNSMPVEGQPKRDASFQA